MEIREFAEIVAEELRRELKEGYNITIEQVRKNNGHIETGLSVRKEGSNIAPVIYLKELKECFEEGKSMEWVTEQLLPIVQEKSMEKKIDMSSFREFETARERIVYKLVNTKKNEEDLKNRPYVEFFDLAVVFYYLVEEETLENGMIQITNEHKRLWDVDTSMLLEAADQNSRLLLGTKVMDLKRLLEAEYGMPKEVLDPMESGGMKILSNRKGHLGASSILYPGLLKSVAKMEGCSLYLLPSSIHEFILLPDRDNQDVSELEETVSQVNKENVSEEEFLSNNVYYYDCNEDEIKLL